MKRDRTRAMPWISKSQMVIEIPRISVNPFLFLVSFASDFRLSRLEHDRQMKKSTHRRLNDDGEKKIVRGNILFR